MTGAVDAYGPFTGPDAIHDADRRRAELEAEDLRAGGVPVPPLTPRAAVRRRGQGGAGSVGLGLVITASEPGKISVSCPSPNRTR